MTFRAAVKQTFRTPVKSMLFFLLLCLCAGLLVMGINLFASSTQALADISQSYQTVGTLQQMPDSTHTEIIDYFGESTFVDTPEYHTVIPQDALENLPTLLPVENRPLVYSTGVKEDGTSLITGTLMYPSYCVTFSPLEDGDSTDSAFLEAHAQEGTGFVLQVEVYSIQWGVSLEEAVPGLLYWPEDLETYPAHLEKGKKYVAYAGPQSSPDQFAFQVQPIPLHSSGNKTSSAMEYAPQLVYEITEQFDTSEEAAMFQALEKNKSLLSDDSSSSFLFPTVPTNSLSLLDPFYQGDVSIKSGREITQEEFATGAKVCLIPESLASDPVPGGGDQTYHNYLQVGDTISLTWLGASYGAAPGNVFLGRKMPIVPFYTGEPLQETAGGQYEIVGIYTTQRAGSNGMLNLGYNQVIVPSKSFDFDSLNILSGGPLDPANVSFQLENNTAEQFVEALDGLGYGEILSVKIQDQGYSVIKKGLDAVYLVALILLISGGISSLSLLVFFVYLQISRQKRETAIRRSLGVGKVKCMGMMLSCVLLVALPGIGLGAAAGHCLTGSVSSRIYEQSKTSGFSREYSDQLEASGERKFDFSGQSDLGPTLGAGAALLGATLLLSGGTAWVVLQKEPLELLSQP